MVFESILFILFIFLFDVFLADAAQAALTLLFTATTAFLGVLLSVCKIVVSHQSFISIMTLGGQNKYFHNVVVHIINQAIFLRDIP